MNNYEVKKAILEKIREYKSIIISRHVRPDGDAVGSTLGLARILRLTFPEKQVYVVNGDYAEYTAFLGAEDAQPAETERTDFTSADAASANTQENE